MIHSCIGILILLVATTGFAYNPFKGKQVDIRCEYKNKNAKEDASLLSDSIVSMFEKKGVRVQELQGLPGWLDEYRMHYTEMYPNNIPKELKEGDGFLCIVTYTREVVFGLRGDMALEGLFGDGSYIEHTNFSTPGGMGGSIGIPSGGGGIPIVINITDENPEWQYQSVVVLDLYAYGTGMKKITLIGTKESSSDLTDDKNTIAENLSDISEELGDAIFKRSKYRRFKRMVKSKKTPRTPFEIDAVVTETLADLIDQALPEVDSFHVSVHVDEWGTISIDSADCCPEVINCLDAAFSEQKLLRSSKPGDTAVYDLQFGISEKFGKRLINGYYCSVNGGRDPSEVWRIVYRYIREYVKHHFMRTFKERRSAFRVQFQINHEGHVENCRVDSDSCIAYKKNDLTEKTLDWKFGIRGDGGVTDVEIIFTLDKKKSFLQVINSGKIKPKPEKLQYQKYR